MIYSCTMFLNEFHLLDLKMAEEMPYIDRMIVVESIRTHSNKQKKLHLHNNAKYKHPKLQVMVVGDKFTRMASKNENFQRDAAIQAINLQDDDIILCSDLDEITRGDEMPGIIEKVQEHGFVKLRMMMYYYKINLKVGTWSFAFGVTGKFLKDKKTLTQLRLTKGAQKIKTNGKHFSYLSDPAGIKYKIESFLHTELDKPKNTSIKNIKKSIKNHQDLFWRAKKMKVVPIDETYPPTILKNLDQWQRFIA